MSIHGAQAGQTLGLGANKDMYITDGELGRITSLGGLSFGSPHGLNTVVEGLTSVNNDALNIIELLATRSAGLVGLDTAVSTFDKGIIVQGAGGIVLSESVTTTTSTTYLQTRTGTLTVVSGKTLSTTNQLLMLSVDDIDIQGDIETGTNYINLETYTDERLVGVGIVTSPTDADLVTGTRRRLVHATTAPAEYGAIVGHIPRAQLLLGGLDLEHITATGMVVGGLQCGTQFVSGVTAANSNNIDDILTLFANEDNEKIYFKDVASTFNALSAQADDGVSVYSHLN
jgi:hypothetical protein